MEIKSINWEQMFKMYPNRFLPVYDDNKNLIEVYDKDTGNSWFKLGNNDNRWTYIG